MSKIIRFAKILELKHGLNSKAALDPNRVVLEAKRDLLNAYRLYVSGTSAKDDVLSQLYNVGESFSQLFMTKMEDVVSNIDKLSENPEEFLSSINELSRMISDKQNKQMVRDFINKKVSNQKKSDQLKVKVELVFKRLSSILSGLSKNLNEAFPSTEGFVGDVLERTPGPLSAKQRLQFIKFNPEAAKYGLDNEDLVGKLLELPEMHRPLDRLIRAVIRHDNPSDMSHVMEVSKDLKELLDIRNKKLVDEQFFDLPEATAVELINKLPPEEAWSLYMQKRKKEKAEDMDDEI